MDRNCIIYKARRNIQVVAHHIFSDEIMSKLYYRLVLKKKLNLKHPKTFNEKLQWLKLYYFPYDSLVIKCSDKYTVREHIMSKGYGDKLVPLLGVWDDAREIVWDTLPDCFVFKCTHGCAYNIVVSDKNKVNRTTTIKQLNKWLSEDFGAFNIEIHYSKIKSRKIICEKFLGNCIMDYKFFCFNGTPKYMYVSTDLIHDRKAQIGFFYIDGKKMPLHRNDYADINYVKLPTYFNEMKSMAQKLSSDFPFVRVDFFITENTFYFAELTFTPGACMMPFVPEIYDLKWGHDLDINYLLKK